MNAKIRASSFRALASLVFAALIAVGAAGCRGGEETAPAAEQQAAGPQRGGTVVTGWGSEPATVNELIVTSNSATNELLHILFLQLLEEQPDFEQHPPTLKPELARSYEFSEDRKTVTFHLREDAVWSDGVPITAEDVRWTWQAHRHPDIGWDNSFAKDAITDVEVVDPRTVRFHFSRVYGKQLLDINEGFILPKHAWEKLPFSEWRKNADWFKQHLVVSGPFTVASWQPQQEVVLVRNERFQDEGLPYLDRVVVRIIPDQSSQMAQLLSGDIDFIQQVSPTDAPQIQANPNLELIPYWFPRITVAVAWNNEHPLFSDPEVRRALTLAIDRQAIVDTLWGSYGKVAVSPIASQIWGHNRSLRPWPYDPEEAKRILAAKGWKDSDGDGVLDKNGKPFSFELGSNAGNQQRNDAAVMIQEQLKRVGIQVQPRVMEFGILMAQADAGQFAAQVSGPGIDTGMDLTTYFHSRSIGTGLNFIRYRNPEVDRLIEKSLEEPELIDAKPHLDRMQQIMHQEQPMTFLWESQRLSAVNRRVHDVKPNVLQTMYNVREWWVRSGR
ncbi:MAG TPA: ABC transporter substrate-binding protein [Thermoanaerobaculia bacterium]|nr:ABC transporter substrate-binding protein [Thermoanaerobaculia bacterium]